MIDDLRHLPRNDDPFQIISEEDAGMVLLAVMLIIIIIGA